MKKNSIVGVIAVLSMSAFLMSCARTLTCYCTTTDSVSQSAFEKDLDKASKKVAKDRDADCYDVEVELRNGYGYRNVSCE